MDVDRSLQTDGDFGKAAKSSAGNKLFVLFGVDVASVKAAASAMLDSLTNGRLDMANLQAQLLSDLSQDQLLTDAVAESRYGAVVVARTLQDLQSRTRALLSVPAASERPRHPGPSIFEFKPIPPETVSHHVCA